MNRNESTEMYLETVYILENMHGHAHSSEIAKRLGVSKPSVTKAMNLLKEEGLINKENYGTVTLTLKGREIAREIYSYHQLITKYLMHSLGLSEKTAEENGCRMEHVVSEEMIEAIKKYLLANHIL